MQNFDANWQIANGAMDLGVLFATPLLNKAQVGAVTATSFAEAAPIGDMPPTWPTIYFSMESAETDLEDYADGLKLSCI